MEVAKLILQKGDRVFYAKTNDELTELIMKVRKKIPYDKDDRVEIIEMTEEEYHNIPAINELYEN